MKKKMYLQRCGKLLCLLLSVALLIDFFTVMCGETDYNCALMAGFYEEPENTLDVVLLGASEVFTDFSSTYAYEKYGFTSFPYALDSNPASLYQAEVREILKKQSPKWLVVEINGMLYDNPENHTGEGSLRRFLDNIPMSRNKLQAICSVVPREEWVNYLFPLSVYHDNWKERLGRFGGIKTLGKIHLRGYSLLKGNHTYAVTPWEREVKETAGDFSRAPLEEQSDQYLRSFLDFCRENQLENVIFVRFPHAVCTQESYARFQRGNEAERIIQESGFDFINMERDYAGIGLDFSRDFSDDDHLNLHGQKKLTDYLGSILAERYGVTPSLLTEKQKESWDTSAEYTRLFSEYYEQCLEKNEEKVLWESCYVMDILEERKGEAK